MTKKKTDLPQRPCGHCNLPGHHAANCHVRARRAEEPDEADIIVAKHITDPRGREVGDVRRDVAKELRAVIEAERAKTAELIERLLDASKEIERLRACEREVARKRWGLLDVAPIGTERAHAFVNPGGLEEIEEMVYPTAVCDAGRRLREARVALSMGLREASRVLGLSVVDVSSIERGALMGRTDAMIDALVRFRDSADTPARTEEL